MKLIDILARELKAWPEGYSSLQQSFAGMVFHGAKDGILPIVRLSVSEDFRIASVTRAQWQAAVDALKSAEKPDLAPCPFCGSSDLNVVQWIECNSCGAFGPTPGDDGDLSIWNKREAQYTTVDMANAARDGFRDGAASVVVELPEPDWSYENFGRLLSKGSVIDAIIAAGGRVKDE
ncbi:hypothetical protein K5E40_03630 [Pseudomonas baetica]|uniref:hypothetical protein n=1 Tax=Pseudomonas baetica TaxID=674054 RepID=UPI001C8B0C5D|nr:hypothetical protein [Pseudomonas baetica]MBX9404765.1 hypothetical protein [Pseudomonas baetica]